MFNKFKNLAALTLGLCLAGSPIDLPALPQNQHSVVLTVEKSNLEGKVDQYQFYVNFENKTYKIPKENNAEFYINGEVMGKVEYKGFFEVMPTVDIFTLNYDVKKEAQLIMSNSKFIKEFSVRDDGNAFVKTNDLISRLYLGRLNFSTGVFKNNPADATETYDIRYNLDFDGVLSFPRLGGFIYLNTEKTPYTIDVLGTIRFNSFDGSKIVGFTLPWTGLLNTDKEQVYLDSILRNNNPSLTRPIYESGLAYFYSGSNIREVIKDFPEYFAIQNNFGSGEIFKIEKEYDGPTKFKSTPFRIAAEGIIGDSRELVTFSDGWRRPKPIVQIKFGYVYDFSDDFIPYGFRISKKEELKNLF